MFASFKEWVRKKFRYYFPEEEKTATEEENQSRWKKFKTAFTSKICSISNGVVNFFDFKAWASKVTEWISSCFLGTAFASVTAFLTDSSVIITLLGMVLIYIGVFLAVKLFQSSKKVFWQMLYATGIVNRDPASKNYRMAAHDFAKRSDFEAFETDDDRLDNSLVPQYVDTLRSLKASPKAAKSIDRMKAILEVCQNTIAEFNYSAVLKTCLYITALFSAGTVIKKSLHFVFSMLPNIIQTTLLYRFGTSSQIANHEFGTWDLTCRSLQSLSKNHDILISSEYRTRLEQAIEEGNRIRKNLTESAKLRTYYLHHNTLIKILGETASKGVSGVRAAPFVIHLSGPPGVGKTNFYKTLAFKLGYGVNDLYCRNYSDDYWSGYEKQKVVVIDEFLNRTDSSKLDTVRSEFLTLCSNATYYPNFANMTGTVGKGTPIAPEVVITMCNEPYPCHSYANIQEGVHRRRDVVIDMALDCPKRVDGKIAYDSYTNEEKSIYSWASFTLLPAIRTTEIDPLIVPFPDLIDAIQSKYNYYQSKFVNQRRERRNAGQDAHSVIREAEAKLAGVPEGSIQNAGLMRSLFSAGRSAWSTLTSFMFPTYAPQGPKADCSPVNDGDPFFHIEESVKEFVNPKYNLGDNGEYEQRIANRMKRDDLNSADIRPPMKYQKTKDKNRSATYQCMACRSGVNIGMSAIVKMADKIKDFKPSPSTQIDVNNVQPPPFLPHKNCKMRVTDPSTWAKMEETYYKDRAQPLMSAFSMIETSTYIERNYSKMVAFLISIATHLHTKTMPTDHDSQAFILSSSAYDIPFDTVEEDIEASVVDPFLAEINTRLSGEASQYGISIADVQAYINKFNLEKAPKLKEKESAASWYARVRDHKVSDDSNRNVVSYADPYLLQFRNDLFEMTNASITSRHINNMEVIYEHDHKKNGIVVCNPLEEHKHKCIIPYCMNIISHRHVGLKVDKLMNMCSACLDQHQVSLFRSRAIASEKDRIHLEKTQAALIGAYSLDEVIFVFCKTCDPQTRTRTFSARDYPGRDVVAHLQVNHCDHTATGPIVEKYSKTFPAYLNNIVYHSFRLLNRCLLLDCVVEAAYSFCGKERTLAPYEQFSASWKSLFVHTAKNSLRFIITCCLAAVGFLCMLILIFKYFTPSTKSAKQEYFEQLAREEDEQLALHPEDKSDNYVSFWTWKEEGADNEPQSSTTTSDRSRQIHRPRKSHIWRKQDDEKQAYLEEFEKQARNNLTCVKFDFGKDSPLPRTGWFVRDGAILTYKHAFQIRDKDMQGVYDVNLSVAGQVYKGCLDIRDIRNIGLVTNSDHKDTDLCVFTPYLTNGKLSFGRKTNLFVTESELENISKTYVAFHYNNPDPEVGKTIAFAPAQRTSGVTYPLTDTDAAYLGDAFKYKIDTENGDCGSLVYCADASHPRAYRKILGIHVAGSPTTKNGIASIITKEDLDRACADTNADFEAQGAVNLGPDDSGFDLVVDPKDYPNLKEIERVPKKQEVFVTRDSKLEESPIAESLTEFGYTFEKKPSVLSADDPRSNGKDPIVTNLLDSFSHIHPRIDEESVDEVFDTMYHRYSTNLEYPIGQRELTMEEACFGVPGYLSGMNLNTSPGFPLCLKRRRPGKKDSLYRDSDGNGIISNELRHSVSVLEDEIEHGRRNSHTFVGFLKDELVRPQKIAEGRSRLTYCGDLVHNVAFMKKFGHLLCAFNNCWKNGLSPVIACNPNSWDFQELFSKVHRFRNRIVAGDYKDFDKRYHPYFQKKAYELIMALVPSDIASFMFKEYHVTSQMDSFAQIGQVRFKPVAGHFSGCFWTTILNCLVNEAYIRHCFSAYHPGKIFDQHIRLFVLGDDHFFSVSDKVEFNPIMLRNAMENLGQVYTSDRKDEPLTLSYRSFDSITFLGSHPVKFRGKYLGALRKPSIEQMLGWMRSSDSFEQVAETALRYAASWGPDYYNKIASDVNAALLENGFDKIVPLGCLAQVRRNALAIAGNEIGLETDVWRAEGPTGRGLTTLPVSEVQTNDPIVYRVAAGCDVMNEVPSSLQFGMESEIFRKTYNWPVGTTGALIAIDAPFGILELGNPLNIQNMPFTRYTYVKFDMTITAQINGTMFHQGLLALWFMPLDHATVTDVGTNYFHYPHVLLSPNSNTTASLTVPFRFYREYINTFAGARGTDNLGWWVLSIVSPLKADPSNDQSVNVSLYSSFPNSTFLIPRPLETDNPVNNIRAISIHDPDLSTPEKFEKQGQSASTTNNITYDVSGVIGEMPSQNNLVGGATDQGIAEGASASIPMPMDNPPLVGGSIPTFSVFPSLAKSNGVDPTTSLQLHPGAMYLSGVQTFSDDDSSISKILSHRNLVVSFIWDKAAVQGTPLLLMPLSSVIGYNTVLGDIWNTFAFWHADIVIEIVAVRTKFHSGFLRGVVAYGAPGLGVKDQEIYYSDIMQFKEMNDSHKMIIPFNAATQWLRTNTSNPTHMTDPIQNASLGTFGLFVANELRCPETVHQEVEVLVFVSLQDARMAVPKPLQTATTGRTTTVTVEQIVPPKTDFEKQGPGTTEEMEKPIDQQVENVLAEPGEKVTETEICLEEHRPCRLFQGAHFPYTVTNLHEIFRRYTFTAPEEVIHTKYSVKTAIEGMSNVDFESDVYCYLVTPTQSLVRHFVGWAGTIRFRFFFSGLSPNSYRPRVYFVPTADAESDTVPCAPFCAGNSDGTMECVTGNNKKVTTVSVGTKLQTANAPLAEEAFHMEGELAYLDVSAPFQTIFRFCSTTRGKQNKIAPGYIHVVTQKNTVVQAYTKVGDDFRCGIWAPIKVETEPLTMDKDWDLDFAGIRI